MTMLEKMAKAMAASRDPNWPWERVPSHLQEAFRADARAALLAIREPNLAVVEAGCGVRIGCSDCDFTRMIDDEATAAFTATIDAILNEAP